MWKPVLENVYYVVFPVKVEVDKGVTFSRYNNYIRNVVSNNEPSTLVYDKLEKSWSYKGHKVALEYNLHCLTHSIHTMMSIRARIGDSLSGPAVLPYDVRVIISYREEEKRSYDSMRTAFEVLEIRVPTMGENSRRHVRRYIDEHSEYINDIVTLSTLRESPEEYMNPLYYNEESGRWGYKGLHIIIENIRDPKAMEELMLNHSHTRKISLAAYLCEPLEEDRIIPFDIKIRMELANVFYKHAAHSEEKIGDVSQGTTHKLDFPDEYVSGSEESTFLLQRSKDVIRDVIEHRTMDPDKLKALHYDIAKYLGE